MTERNSVFLDTSFFLALAHIKDKNHQAARELMKEIKIKKAKLFTSHFVLIEVGDGLSRLRFRELGKRIIELTLSDPDIVITPATPELFSKAWQLFSRMDDKEWGLTDCASFIIMDENGIEAAGTADHHFQQAGFRALLLEQNIENS